MHKDIIQSPLADDDLYHVIEYLLSNQNPIVANNFLDILYEHLEIIANNPKQFPLVYKTRKYRKCVVTKHNTVYYKEQEANILVLRIFDTRQNPKKLKLKFQEYQNSKMKYFFSIPIEFPLF